MTAVTTTPFSWMEATFRYTEVKNQKYGPVYYSGNQSLKDKSFDFKIKLVEESDYIPSIALGMRDIGGTGLFSSEYIAATKNFGPLDLTLGIGWGQLGRLANIGNPFNSFHDSFKRRSGDYGEGGTLNYNSWFSGEDVGLFGGLEYSFKYLGTRLKIEYDTSSQDRASYPLIPIEIKSKINYGLAFPMGQWGAYSFGSQRGHTFQFSFFFEAI